MVNMAISDLNEKLERAQRAGVELQLNRLRTAFKDDMIVCSDNEMATDATKFLRNLVSNKLNSVPARSYPDMIGEYVAASTFLHVYDAHSYLASAWESTLQGYRSIAAHLAYYSELRAVMAMLACDGIGVFQENHCIIEKNGNGTNIADKGKTHQFCWDAFKWWGESQQASSLLDLVIVDGRSIRVWLESFPSGGATQMICSSFLKGIGLDIHLLSRADMSARGRASYRPCGIEGLPFGSADADLSMIRMFGEQLAGPNGPRDSNLGILILCATLRRAFSQNWSTLPENDYVKFSKEVKVMIASMEPGNTTKMALKLYCLTDPLPPIPVLSDALNKIDGELEGVLSRATLLCYHSVLYCRHLFSSCSIMEKDLRFWWQPALEARGALRPGLAPSSNDIVQDVLTALDELSSLAMPADRLSLWREAASVLANSCRCERLAIAGLFA